MVPKNRHILWVQDYRRFKIIVDVFMFVNSEVLKSMVFMRKKEIGAYFNRSSRYVTLFMLVCKNLKGLLW
jgi:hypothetical protein